MKTLIVSRTKIPEEMDNGQNKASTSTTLLFPKTKKTVEQMPTEQNLMNGKNELQLYKREREISYTLSVEISKISLHNN